MTATYEIRPIKPASIFRMNYCSEGICLKPATHYLVRKKCNPLDRAESRVRRCEEHARENAASLGIEFVSAKP